MVKLTEFFNTKNKLQLEEAADGALRLEVPFLTADEPTANGRVYPRKVLEGAVASLQKRLDAGPGYGSSRHLEKMEVDDVSHFLEGVEMKGKTAIATLRVLPTEKGKNVAAMIRNGGALGVSARGAGTVRTQEGYGVVGDDFSLEGVDFCLNPASGHFANQRMVCESAPLDAEEHLDEEQALKDRYYDAIRTAGFRGDFETFKMSQDRETMGRVAKLRERYASALKAGFRGTETEYFGAMEK